MFKKKQNISSEQLDISVRLSSKIIEILQDISEAVVSQGKQIDELQQALIESKKTFEEVGKIVDESNKASNINFKGVINDIKNLQEEIDKLKK